MRKAENGHEKERSPLAEGRELKWRGGANRGADVQGSPLAEGRELKCGGKAPHGRGMGVAPPGGAGIEIVLMSAMEQSLTSPLAEGRELKYTCSRLLARIPAESPLAEGRELKSSYMDSCVTTFCRPSRRGVN